MKLTSFTDYSLRVLLYLAADPDRRATVAEIAASYGISEHHLVKVVHFLGKRGWVDPLRGKGGGIRLAHAAADIGIGRVVRETEGAAELAECFQDDGGRCRITEGCRLKGVLGEAVAAFYAALDRHTLADILRDHHSLVQLVQFAPRPTPPRHDPSAASR